LHALPGQSVKALWRMWIDGVFLAFAFRPQGRGGKQGHLKIEI